ncbi:MAG: DNA polymerase I [Candidatus Omnitrophica bacterium]|nr:DNA polymerase I [Candidatus Omnitrophota bacterium]
MQRKKLFLVDGNSYSYRAYYAISGLSTSDGRPTGAVYGFVAMLNKLRSEMTPDYLVVCFDLKGPTLRHKKFADYKINRKPMPDDLAAQMPVIKEVVRSYGIPIFEMQGYEADDIIATLAGRFKDDLDIYIVSSDKDMLQLVDKYVKIYNPQKKNGIIDAKKVFDDYKVKPNQITDLLALAGDSSDNIPGVPNIGVKTAAELIQAFGSLDNILAKTSEIKQQKRREMLEQFAEQARLSKELATVISDIPLDINLKSISFEGVNNERLGEIFRDLEFKSLYRDLISKSAVVTDDLTVEIIETCLQFGEFCIDIAYSKDSGYKIYSSGEINLTDIKNFLEPVFADPKIMKVGYDFKNKCMLINKWGICLAEPLFDTMIAAYLLDPNSGTLALSEIAAIYLNRSIDNSRLGSEQLFIKDKLLQQLQEQGLEELFFKIEMPLVMVLLSMEQAGITVDKRMLTEFGKQIDEKIEVLIKKIYDNCGCEFNVNSPKQLSEVLFTKLKLPIIKKGKSGPSTNEEVLMQLSSQHSLPALILEYRELAKLKSTYVTGILELIDKDTERIHTSFNQAVTATGRLSSSAPNLQNIPIKTEMGRKIRAAFIAQDGCQLLSVDYSQIELRVLAHLSKDANLIEAFRANRDIHTYTASLIFALKEEEVTEKMRDLAKRVNFGIIYGMGAYGLARDLGASHEEAKRFIAEYFKRYPSVKTYLDKQIDEARGKGYVITLLNRRRSIPQINSKNAMMRGFAERTAMNTPIQGTAADLIKAAMIVVYRQIKKDKMKTQMVLQVHDELVFEVPGGEMEEAKKIIKKHMEKVFELEVPIRVSLKTGLNWRDMD